MHFSRECIQLSNLFIDSAYIGKQKRFFREGAERICKMKNYPLKLFHLCNKLINLFIKCSGAFIVLVFCYCWLARALCCSCNLVVPLFFFVYRKFFMKLFKSILNGKARTPRERRMWMLKAGAAGDRWQQNDNTDRNVCTHILSHTRIVHAMLLWGKNSHVQNYVRRYIEFFSINP